MRSCVATRQDLFFACLSLLDTPICTSKIHLRTLTLDGLLEQSDEELYNVAFILKYHIPSIAPMLKPQSDWTTSLLHSFGVLRRALVMMQSLTSRF